MSTESTEPSRTSTLQAAALDAMSKGAERIRQVLPQLLAQADTLPGLIDVRLETNHPSWNAPYVRLQPATVTDAEVWAAHFGVVLTTEDGRTSWTDEFERHVSADFERDGVHIRIGACQFYTASQWAELHATTGQPLPAEAEAPAVSTLAQAHAGGDR
ncbi:hypothetical protein AB0903_17735 [Streptomyces sp. NPDC048389]|uniref:hypothetical protein n=1 Tax=Streptomyces sp. NPDC048389 TaxID=3154622 RepID=UPI0034548E5B